MFPSPEETIMDYERHNLSNAIIEIAARKAKCKPESKEYEFFTSIEEVMIALQYTATENHAMRRAYKMMVARVDIVERLLLVVMPKPELFTHEVVDLLRGGEKRG